ncbi:ArsR/SmtB family transcription factor [Shouchella patagoniensis]|uniref:ArsR/SmtB family transcription factor n=1 Tax=Shouchella patagoniensis TaxID=228576 RepID=UPI0009955DBD|nr:winged helix-turn-helix domain-containing protein [Shouchella patagoniensis]
MKKHEAMEINLKQQKVISDPLRTQIIQLLDEKPMTPKQTADRLNKNPGTIYYHIQQLFKHDILEIDHVSTNKGIVEKYYKSKATFFKSPREENEEFHSKSQVFLTMSEELLEAMNFDIQELFYEYGKKAMEETSNKKAYQCEFLVKEYEEVKIEKEEEGE